MSPIGCENQTLLYVTFTDDKLRCFQLIKCNMMIPHLVLSIAYGVVGKQTISLLQVFQ